jgi:hypothetical protein
MFHSERGRFLLQNVRTVVGRMHYERCGIRRHIPSAYHLYSVAPHIEYMGPLYSKLVLGLSPYTQIDARIERGLPGLQWLRPLQLQHLFGLDQALLDRLHDISRETYIIEVDGLGVHGG